MRAATAKENGTQARAAGAKRAARAGSLENIVLEVRNRMGDEWPPLIYTGRVLAMRTRSHAVPPAARNVSVEILHTLLGVELKVGRRRISCPDLATARYLSVFARAGVAEVAVPYDITKISHLADEFEFAWQRMLLLADHATRERAAPFRTRVRAAVAREAGREIAEAGAGTAIPQFNQNTRQRPQRI
ncbi:MAG TPA: hypothetical protein VFA21_00745 [Pyrinomonadaceae bacterium]|jgi:hypothetical protein|nr:hypothetical protein [Pyrinomonadaceae bacterium]